VPGGRIRILHQYQARGRVTAKYNKQSILDAHCINPLLALSGHFVESGMARWDSYLSVFYGHLAQS
jgi:hypothetical protein